ncbi:MAG TPA: tetratricopeptide repeat protein [Rhodanobacteraceae bacterium]|nr:tetratricopeptide repeat protein [Rhodanobacteraceae bacterium]
MNRLFVELRRRNVLRAAVLYVGAVWALAQGIAQLGPSIGAPEWITRWFLVAAAIGFPFWIAFAWYFEWTPAGLKRESEIESDPSDRRRTRRTLDLAIVGVLSIAVVLLLADRFVGHRGADAAPSEKSIAVLPLLNESGDPQQDYFSDGLSEELISALAQVETLKVIGRGSSFRFRGHDQDDTAAIGAKLGVATLLEGSVRKQGDQVRIVASLVRAADGSALWSQTYDRKLQDVFAMQSEIATAVAGALKAKLLGNAPGSADKPPGGNLDAYYALLQGRFHAARRNRDDHFKAVAAYQRAIELDPAYSIAYARLANAQQWFVDWVATGDERKTIAPEAKANAEKALALDPRSAVAMGVLGINQSWSQFDMRTGEATLKKAVALDPSNPETLYQLADVTGCLGRLDESVVMMRKVLAMEPLNAQFHFNMGQFLLGLGRVDEAEAELRQAIELQPAAAGFRLILTQAYIKHRRFAEAVSTAQAETDPATRRAALAQAYFAAGNVTAGEPFLDEMIRLDGASYPTYIAEVYALRGDADKAFEWFEKGYAIRDPGAAIVYEDVIFTPAVRGDPRLAVLAKKLNLPDPKDVPDPWAASKP